MMVASAIASPSCGMMMGTCGITMRNPKFQIPNSKQIPNPKLQNVRFRMALFSPLELGAWSFFGFRNLNFGILFSHPQKISRGLHDRTRHRAVRSPEIWMIRHRRVLGVQSLRRDIQAYESFGIAS